VSTLSADALSTVAESDASTCDQPLVSRLEWRRKLAHMLPGLIPFVMWHVYHEDPLPAWNLAVAAAVVAGLTLIAIRNPRGIRRDGTENWLQTCLAYAIPPLLVLILFPANAEYAAVVLCVLAFGDTAAALGGTLFGKRALPWNADKTWVGLLCFVLCAVPLATVAYWGEAQPAVPLSVAAICGATAAGLAAVAESLRSRIDDNVRVSVAAAVGVVLGSRILTAGM